RPTTQDLHSRPQPGSRRACERACERASASGQGEEDDREHRGSARPLAASPACAAVLALQVGIDAVPLDADRLLEVVEAALEGDRAVLAPRCALAGVGDRDDLAFSLT